MTDLALPLALMSAAALRHWSSSTSPMTTLAPSLTKRRASAAPFPRAPPEIRATLPLSRSIGFASLDCSFSQSVNQLSIWASIARASTRLPVRANQPPLLDDEKTPFAGHAFEAVRAAIDEL